MVAESPEFLNSLLPRQFEELVAELLAAHGWEVSLTPATRDGGYDILGVSRDATGLETTWAVECKHFRQDRKVSVDVLRALHGVKESLGLSHGLLVTSSTVTADAKRYAQNNHGLHIVERDALVRWFLVYNPRPSATSYIVERTFYSCFVSHSHKDELFVSLLVERLRNVGVRVWFAPEDILPGRKIHEEVSRAIDLFDKVLLVISRESMNSAWVRTEIRKAKKRELKENRRVLFPISLVPISDIRSWELFDADLGEDLAAEIREYLIPDFSNWKDEGSFEAQLKKVVSGLLSK